MEKCISRLTAMLCCPESGQALHPADGAELSALRARGHSLPEGALVRADGTRVYPIRDSFPVMLPEEAIVLDGEP